MCVCVCVCLSFLPLVLLLPAVISEGKVIRCLIGGSWGWGVGSVNQSAPCGVCMCESPANSSVLVCTHTNTEDMHRILGSKNMSR